MKFLLIFVCFVLSVLSRQIPEYAIKNGPYVQLQDNFGECRAACETIQCIWGCKDQMEKTQNYQQAVKEAESWPNYKFILLIW